MTDDNFKEAWAHECSRAGKAEEHRARLLAAIKADALVMFHTKQAAAEVRAEMEKGEES